MAAKKAESTSKARLILKYASETKTSLATQCNNSRNARRRGGGALTHQEQDLLRAMVVFAGAGLDACLKQLVRDALKELSAKDDSVRRELETFVSRSLRGDGLAGQSESSSGGREFLAKALVASVPREYVAAEYIKDLTGDSLQSVEQLFRAARALGVAPDALGLDAKRLKQIFEARNQIIHEMDIDLGSKAVTSRKRRSRTVEDMTAMADDLLTVAGRVVEAVEGALLAG